MLKCAKLQRNLDNCAPFLQHLDLSIECPSEPESIASFLCRLQSICVHPLQVRLYLQSDATGTTKELFDCLSANTVHGVLKSVVFGKVEMYDCITQEMAKRFPSIDTLEANYYTGLGVHFDRLILKRQSADAFVCDELVMSGMPASLRGFLGHLDLFSHLTSLCITISSRCWYSMDLDGLFSSFPASLENLAFNIPSLCMPWRMLHRLKLARLEISLLDPFTFPTVEKGDIDELLEAIPITLVVLSISLLSSDEEIIDTEPAAFLALQNPEVAPKLEIPNLNVCFPADFESALQSRGISHYQEHSGKDYWYG